MKPFEIWSWQPPGWPTPHPCVVVSGPARAASKPDVEVVMCSSQRAGRAAQAGEVILDAADGLNWPTICKCDLIHAVDRNDLSHRRGEVSPPRRGLLVRTILSAHGWSSILTSD